MAINEHAIKQQVNRHISSAMMAIKNKATNLQWAKTVNNVAGEISRLSRSINTSMNNVQHFGNMQLKMAGSQHSYSINQSITSKLDMLTDLDFYILNEWKKVQDVLWYEAKKSPFEGKNEVELFDMLAGEVEAFDKLLKENANLSTKILSNTEMKTEATIIQREISHLKTLPQATTPSFLLMVAIWLRLMPFLFASRK